MEIYLSAPCEYNEEVKRIAEIRKFLEKLPGKYAVEFLEMIIQFATWFKQSADYYLGKYTDGVAGFLKTHHLNYRGREDYFFSGDI